MSKEKLKNGINEALKNKATLRLSVLRGLLSAYVNELVSKGRKPDSQLTPEEEIMVYKKQASQRKDSITAFQDGNRTELAEKEKAELAIIEEFLPPALPEEEIEKIARQKKEELQIEDSKKIGLLIGAVMKETQGRTDGNTVKAIIEKIFSEN